MSQAKALLWKESRETLIYLWIGLFLFLVLPVIGALEYRHKNGGVMYLDASPWVLTCGGVLAVLIAVGATCRDLRPGLTEFWRSRAVSPIRWMLVKYAVGLVILEIVCIAPLLCQYFGSPWYAEYTDASGMIRSLPFLYLANYSISFLAGCVVRKTAHAAMLGIAALLLLWFLPTVLPSLHWAAVVAYLDHDPSWSIVAFSIGMMGLSAIALIASLIAVQTDWRLRSGPKLMYGAIAGAVLILLGSFTVRLGTNLPVLRSLSLGPDASVGPVVWTGDVGAMLIYQRQQNWTLLRTNRAVKITPSGFEVVPAEGLESLFSSPADADMSPPGHPDIFYFFSESPAGDPGDRATWLGVGSRKAGEDLKNRILIWQSSPRTRTLLHVHDNRVFVMNGAELVTFDISDPVHPTELSRSALPFNWNDDPIRTGEQTILLALPQFPGVPPRERLQSVLGYSWGVATEGDLLCIHISGVQLSTYRLQDLNPSFARYERIAVQRSSVLERFFGYSRNAGLHLKNGVLYSLAGMHAPGVNPSLTLYDARRLRVLGHFAAPGISYVDPLPDGRAVIMGSTMYLLGPPKR